jgi:hypothetical protein
MIYREILINDAPRDVQLAFRYLNNRLFIYDSFVLATSSNDLGEIEKIESRIKKKITKPNWIRDVKSGNGIVFIIQHGSKRFKGNKTIDWAIEQTREQFDSTLAIDRFEKHEKFDVFFIGVKKLKQSENENENANQTV